jgi:hypothetical protein
MTAADVGLVESAVEAALAVVELLAYPWFHLKSLRWCLGSWPA